MSIPLFLGSLLFVGLGALLWTLAVRSLRLRAAMRSWPVEKGIVQDHRTRPSRSSIPVDVLVRFSHKGREHTVWCVSPTRSGYGRDGGEQGFRQEKARFKVSAEVDVYVNPREPEQAYLELPESHMIMALLCFGALLIALPVGMYLAAWFQLSEEMVTLGFMLLLGGVLTIFAISMGYALFRIYFPRRRPN